MNINLMEMVEDLQGHIDIMNRSGLVEKVLGQPALIPSTTPGVYEVWLPIKDSRGYFAFAHVTPDGMVVTIDFLPEARAFDDSNV